MQNITKELNRDLIYTFVGRFTDENSFITDDDKIIDCLAYRHHRFYMNKKLSAINIQYIYCGINDWVIFQCVLME